MCERIRAKPERPRREIAEETSIEHDSDASSSMSLRNRRAVARPLLRKLKNVPTARIKILRFCDGDH